MKTLDPKKLEEAIQRLVAALQPERIYLYGSHAYGQPSEDSDLDLLVVLPDSHLPPHRRAVAAYRALRGLSLPAEILIDHEPPVLDTACFHCQQAVEKTLKAFLVWQAIPFERVHNLTYLLDLCASKEAGLVSLRERAESLTPYAVEARYPGELLDVDRAEAADALESARAVWNFVLGLFA